MKKTICVDLDGTLAKYDRWRGIHEIGEPFPFAKEWMEDIAERYRLVIFTVRTNVGMNGNECPDELSSFGQKKEYLTKLVADWLDKNEIPWDSIWSGQGKPVASYYVDDRAVHVKNGVYPEL